ncbi:sugar transferase [Methylocystis heyeri]|uniref:sugar transferase n=1 Tax=Methylocystis heyeri TaxID=391905 RepID=UPI0013894B4A|nr:sugar transferase [Methylocystis heyeri]
MRDPGLLDTGNFPNELAPGYQYALVTIVCALVAFRLFRVSDGVSHFFSVHDVLAVCAAVATTATSSGIILFIFTRLEGIPRSMPLIYALVLGSGMIFSRTLARVLYNEAWSEADKIAEEIWPQHMRHVILIGVDRFAATAIKLLDLQQPRTTRVVGALDVREAFHGRTIAGVKIIGHVDEIAEVFDEYAVHGVEIDEIWLADGATSLSHAGVERMRDWCAGRGLKFARVSEALNLAVRPNYSKPRANRTGAVVPGEYFKTKRLIDLAGASTLLILLLPLALLTACLVLFDVGAPVFFWQQRIGQNGRKFLLYKFRTYRAPFDKSGARIPGDLRLSRLGRAVRAARLDEIPQLLNVLVGDMSLIGPRPLLSADQPGDPRPRLSVKPGITGWAQINGGTFITPAQKDALDVWYIRHASLRLDTKIAVSTLLFTLVGEKINHTALEEAMSWSESNTGLPAMSLEHDPTSAEVDTLERRSA